MAVLLKGDFFPMSHSKFNGKTVKELYEMNEKNLRKMFAIYPAQFILLFLADKNISFSLLFFIVYYKFIKSSIKSINFMRNYEINVIKSVEYENLYKSYMIMLKEVLELLKNLNADNEMKMFAMYIYLYRKGFLSLNHEFYFSTFSHDSRYYPFGANIACGEGCCRHISSMLNDLLHLSNIQSYNIIMNLDDSFSGFVDDVPIQLGQIDEDDVVVADDFFTKIARFLDFTCKFNRFNHCATLFVDDEHSYIMDATNNSLFFIHDSKAFNCNYFEIGYYKAFNDFKKIKLSKVLEETNCKKIELLSNDYYNIINMCKECDDIFEKFYKEHKDLYGEIVDKRRILGNELSKYDIFQLKYQKKTRMS